jgi:phenylpropionate dioxygenase-like ring-hydroxylating dioxygenase large terminal subunit
MASAILKYLGYGPKAEACPLPAAEPTQSAVRALPAVWYTSQAMYDLERRAIFSRKWLLITHQLRLQIEGDYLRYDAANFQFILYRDSTGGVSGVHNTSGLTGEPIVHSQKGHMDTENFETDTFPIHVKVDRMGFLWVNLDSAESPEIPWEEDFDDVDVQPRFEGFHLDDEYEFDHEWEMTGAYNWKILADNYNECYHCATTHPDLKEMADLETYSVTPQDGYILHNVRGRPGGEGEERFKVHPTYYYPSTSMNVS